MRRIALTLLISVSIAAVACGAAPTQYYVDPGGGEDSSGNGAIGSPYATVQYCLNDIPTAHGGPDSTNGDQINIKAGSALTIGDPWTLATYGTPTATAPLIFRGYTTAANDGGEAEINVNDKTGLFASTSYNYISLIDLYIHNASTSSGTAVQLNDYCYLCRCRFADGNNGVEIDNYGVIEECSFTEFYSTRYIDIDNACVVRNCYFKDGTNKPTQAVFVSGYGNVVDGNIFSLADDTIGVTISRSYNSVLNNTISATTGSGKGIYFDAATHDGCTIRRNIIAGFSAGGDGIDFGSLQMPLWFYGNNAFYNNAEHEANANDALTGANPVTADNEALEEDPFERDESDAFATRKDYFAPKNIGGLWIGSGEFDKGAVQHVATGGGETSHVWVR